MKIGNVFHPNLLQKVFIDLLINEINKPLLSISINNKKKWKIKDI